MPPRKTIAKLQELAFSATSKLVHVSCKTVEDEFPTPVDMDADTSGCKRAVQEMQNHLLRYIRPDDWEPMFQAVMELQQQDRILDQRIIYCTFINENINLRKMKFGYKHENFDLATVLKRPLVDFWLLQHLPLFTQLVEADFTDALCDNIPVMCKALVNLETVTLPQELPLESMESVIKSCGKLRKVSGRFMYQFLQVRLGIGTLEHLEYTDWLIGDLVPNNLNRDRKLKLRNLTVFFTIVENLRVILEMCPLVDELSILLVDNEDETSELLQILATSTLKIQKLRLLHCTSSPALSQLCSSKAIYLNTLDIQIPQEMNPLPRIQNIADTCANLKNFRFHVAFLVADDQLDDLTFTHEISFPQLEYLSIVNCAPGEGGIFVAFNCLWNAPKLATLTYFDRASYELNVDYSRAYNLLTQLFSNARVNSLSNVTLWCERAVIPLQLIQTVCDNCKEMASLKIGKLSEEAEDYLKELCIEAKMRKLLIEYDALSTWQQISYLFF